MALTWLVVLFLAAVLAPWVARSHPLWVSGDGGTEWPGFWRGLASEDLYWLAALCGGLGWWWRSHPWVLGPLLVLTLTLVVLGWGRGDPVNFAVEDWGSRSEKGERQVWTPVRFGPADLDKGRELLPVGSPGHPLGTDAVGRDVLARLLFGARTTLKISVVAAGLAVLIGIGVGLVLGWRGGWSDQLGHGLIQVVACFPALILILAVGVFWGPQPWWIAVVFALFGWTETALLVRAEVRRVRTLPHMESARALGVSTWRLVLRHALPHAVGPAIVQGAFLLGSAVLVESTLAFLGLSPGGPASWGRLLQEGRDHLPAGVHLVVLPGLMVTATVAAFAGLGEWGRRPPAG